MLINEENKHLHFLMPKTGSGTIYMFCKNYKKLNMHSGIQELKHIDPQLFNNIISDESWNITCLIRNPWEHAVSFYFHALDKKRFFKENFFGVHDVKNINENDIKKLDLSFERFLNYSYIKNRSQTFYIDKFNGHYNIINEYINYNDTIQFQYLLNKMGVIEPKYRKHDKKDIETVIPTDHKQSYKYFFNDSRYNLIKNHCKKEIEMFNYEL